MKIKRFFKVISTLATLINVVFLASNCRGGKVIRELVTQVIITYSRAHGTPPQSKNVDKGYKLTAGDLPSISAEGFVFEG